MRLLDPYLVEIRKFVKIMKTIKKKLFLKNYNQKSRRFRESNPVRVQVIY
jgi:hypothetical protein